MVRWADVRVVPEKARRKSRVAKIESGDASVSLDLLVRATFASGATRKEMARAIA